MKQAEHSSGSLVWLMPLGLVLFSAGIWCYDLWPPDEPRFAEVAREMAVSGDYLVPRVNGETYLEKPPLLFWASALAGLPMGQVDEVAARVPSVLAAILVVLLSFLIARDAFGRRTALLTALILLSSARFWWQARVGQIDTLLTACVVTAVYALWRWDETRRVSWLALFWLALTAGVYAKGPPALVAPMLLLLVYYRKDRIARRGTHWVIGLTAVALLTALWYIPARMAGADGAQQAVETGIWDNLFRNTVGRMFLGVSKAQPPWYYLETIPVDLLPWSLFLPWTLWWTWKHRRDGKGMRFVLCWVAPALIFFSISIGKRAIYILPLFPGFAMLLAASVEALWAEGRRRWLTAVGAIHGGLVTLLGAGLLAFPWLPNVGVMAAQAPEGAAWFGSAASVQALGGLAVVSGLGALFLCLSTRGRAAAVSMAVSTMAVLTVLPFTVLPMVNNVKSARHICAHVPREGAEVRVYSAGFMREEYVFYTQRFIDARFTGLVGEAPADLSALMEAAGLQRRARKLVAEAAAEKAKPFAAGRYNSSPGAWAEVRAAIDEAVARDEDADALRAFESDLMAELDGFFREFAGPGPAYCFVQEDDLRWMLALTDEEFAFTIIEVRQVGRRNVVLLANADATDPRSAEKEPNRHDHTEALPEGS